MGVGEIGGTVEVTRARILVVEDDPEAALFLVHVLANRCRFEVIHTADPVTALRLAADEHWDLVVTDLDMPGMTGLELLGALRQLAPALPVAVVSAHVLDGAPGRAARARGPLPGEAAAGGPAHRDRDRPDRPGTAFIR